MDKLKRKSLLIAVDAVLVNVAVLLAFMVRFESFSMEYWSSYFLYYSLPLTAIMIVCFNVFGLYNRVWRYASIGELISTIKAVSMGTLLGGFLMFVVQQQVPRSVVFLVWMFNIFLVGSTRLGWRMVRGGYLSKVFENTGKRVLIVGAGDGGALVAREYRTHYRGEVCIVGFIDDDPVKQDHQIFGYPVLGTRHRIPEVVETHRVEEIVIAMPSVKRKALRDVVGICQETSAVVKILPGVYDLIDGNVTINQIREVEVEDLLSRDPVELDLDSIGKYISDQMVLVTGAGGSIGSELCRQIVNYNPRTLLLLDSCENNVYDIEMELRSETTVPVIPLVKDVRDRETVNEVFKTYKPKVVFHAAAYKHVPLMEVNTEEAIKNNVMGTYFVAQAANLHNADRFVLVSTDKAVHPTSIMGASKRIAEMVIQHLNRTSRTRYAAVRFGNVLGSRGSVVPLFKKQIAQGGPLTVTHPDMVRYFMTIPEAVQLIIQAGALADGGEIFVLDMGDPVPIMKLAKTLIKLSGLEPGEDIEIQVTGIRPGEKLFEELMTEEEGVNSTTHERIFVTTPGHLDTVLLDKTLAAFSSGILPTGEQETEELIGQFLPEFKRVLGTQSSSQASSSAPGVTEVAAQAEE